jgi:dTMP kinase
MPSMRGLLIAFEGLDQSGKETQAQRLAEGLTRLGRNMRLASFPDYVTPIGREIGRALHGEQEYPPDVMQLLYIANRYERKPDLAAWIAAGDIVLCDRYLASSVAYGETQGLDPAWLLDTQRHLPQPDLTILLDIAPATAVARKAVGRDRYERDLALLTRVRESYRRLARAHRWVSFDGERPKDDLAREILGTVSARLVAA